MAARVTIISTLPPIKGLSPYTLGLVTALSKKIQLDFLGFKSIYPNFLYPGGAIDKTAKAPKFNANVRVKNSLVWWNPVTWIEAGLSIKTQVVHAQWWSWFLAPVFMTVLGIAKLRGKKIILTIHNVQPHEKSFLKKFLNRSVIWLGDEYVVHNQSNKKLFLKLTQTKKPVQVIPIGITELKKSTLTKSQLRKKYHFKSTAKILLFFGNIRDYKGLDILIQSVGLLKDEKIQLIIAGKPWASFEKYQNLIDQNKLKDRTSLFLEYISERKIAELFKLSDLVVYPYKEFEASSAAATLALNFGKPMVVTNVGGLPEVVLNKKVIAKPNSSKDLARKIQYAFLNIMRPNKKANTNSHYFSWRDISKLTSIVYL